MKVPTDADGDGQLETRALYPYVLNEGRYQRAFRHGPSDDDWDALDLQPRRGEEERLVSGLEPDSARERLVTHRIAAGECPYPNAARYLLAQHEQLASRRPGVQIVIYVRTPLVLIPLAARRRPHAREAEARVA